jgi:hypothetical protein
MWRREQDTTALCCLGFSYPSKLNPRNKKADTVWRRWHKEFACLLMKYSRLDFKRSKRSWKQPLDIRSAYAVACGALHRSEFKNADPGCLSKSHTILGCVSSRIVGSNIAWGMFVAIFLCWLEFRNNYRLNLLLRHLFNMFFYSSYAMCMF